MKPYRSRRNVKRAGKKACYHPGESALAAPGLSDNADHLREPDVQTDLVQNDLTGESAPRFHSEVFDFEKGIVSGHW